MAMVKLVKKKDLLNIWHCSAQVKMKERGLSDLSVCGRRTSFK